MRLRNFMSRGNGDLYTLRTHPLPLGSFGATPSSHFSLMPVDLCHLLQEDHLLSQGFLHHQTSTQMPLLLPPYNLTCLWLWNLSPRLPLTQSPPARPTICLLAISVC